MCFTQLCCLSKLSLPLFRLRQSVLFYLARSSVPPRWRLCRDCFALTECAIKKSQFQLRPQRVRGLSHPAVLTCPLVIIFSSVHQQKYLSQLAEESLTGTLAKQSAVQWHRPDLSQKDLCMWDVVAGLHSHNNLRKPARTWRVALVWTIRYLGIQFQMVSVLYIPEVSCTVRIHHLTKQFLFFFFLFFTVNFLQMWIWRILEWLSLVNLLLNYFKKT